MQRWPRPWRTSPLAQPHFITPTFKVDSLTAYTLEVELRKTNLLHDVKAKEYCIWNGNHA